MLLKPSDEREGEKWYYVLAMVPEETRRRKHGRVLHSCGVLPHLIGSTNVQDTHSIPPRWDFKPESLLVDDPVYEVASVPSSSIALATRNSLQVGSPVH